MVWGNATYLYLHVGGSIACESIEMVKLGFAKHFEAKAFPLELDRRLHHYGSRDNIKALRLSRRALLLLCADISVARVKRAGCVEDGQ